MSANGLTQRKRRAPYLLKPSTVKSGGHAMFSLYRDNKQHTFLAGRLVTELFRIKPLEWEWSGEYGGQWMATNGLGDHYTVYEQDVYTGDKWVLHISGYEPKRCASPEEGKQLAEQHWRNYIAQALVSVETEQ